MQAKKNTISKFIGFMICLGSLSTFAQENSLSLWYTKPSEKWTDALPIGNGRMGAMIYAGVQTDHLQFNEDTFWTCGPRNYNQKDAYLYLPQIRSLLAEGKQKEAENLAQEHFMGLKSEAENKNTWVNRVRKLSAEWTACLAINYDDSKWQDIHVPNYDGWENESLPNVDGAVWFRTTFEVPENWKGQDLVLDLNRIYNQDFTYVNGEMVGNTDSNDPRTYTIPAKLMKVGKNALVIQVLNYTGKGGLLGFKEQSKSIGIYPKGSTVSKGISLNKTWKCKIQDSNPPLTPEYQASYQPFGDLNLIFKHDKDEVSGYKRSLDLKTAISLTEYTLGNTHYRREYFASAPNQAIVVHLSADKAKAISFKAVLSSLHQEVKVEKIDNQTIAIRFKVKGGVLRGESRLKILLKNGTIKVDEHQALVVENADDAVLYLTAGTNFVTANDVTGNPATQNLKALTGIKGKTYEAIKKAHIQDYQRYFNAFQVNFGSAENDKLPTDERLAKFAQAQDPGFMALYMQYGRYLLISSSYPGSQPANLQGIWNDALSPSWGSKYTTNINLEMNYWPAEVLNLSAFEEPLFSKIKGLAKTGEQTAKAYYNAPGWVLHHNTDLWNATAPINASNHGIWVTGAAWLCQQLWEHYLFTQDKNFLSKEAYPLMKQSALFFDAFLVKDSKTGWLISTPSNSPENGGLVAGPTMDHQIIRSLFANVIEASEVLNIDSDLRKKLSEKKQQIAPNQIGKYGQLQEWMQDVDDTTNKHRHVSHLWGVYPGKDITWDTNSTLMNAAKQSLLYRGDEATGWSLAWKINFWARFKEGDHAMKLVKMLMRPAKSGAGSYVNLFDAHPPFQIDGNFGGSAGIAEMLLQSHQGYLDIFPALPADLPFGEVKGLRARGGFELNLSWDKGSLKKLVVTSKAGLPCVIKYKGKEISFKTETGESYTFNGNLEKI
ncbi:glycosyl hydrolase family 95 catalytic domain-containing protein [Pedobacter sp. MW01-1-1]|uniref:glycosyl hydrolase family 95 catalytic domain-containing protein n=1 Tax=Pedobacter sp. MW01-1-1 TaxID=3383027 RepID=UPI003FF12902